MRRLVVGVIAATLVSVACIAGCRKCARRFVVRSVLPRPPGTFASLAPSRILDTRIRPGVSGTVRREPDPESVCRGCGWCAHRSASTRLPSTSPRRTRSALGHLTVLPDGPALAATRATSTSPPGQTVANLVVVEVGHGGAQRGQGVDREHESAGRSSATGWYGRCLADVVGWFSDGSTTADGFTGLVPTRLLDTRSRRRACSVRSLRTRRGTCSSATPAPLPTPTPWSSTSRRRTRVPRATSRSSRPGKACRRRAV